MKINKMKEIKFNVYRKKNEASDRRVAAIYFR